MEATMARALRRRNITLKTCHDKLVTDYNFEPKFSAFAASYATKRTCGKGGEWDKVIACLDEYGIRYKQGFGWI